MMKYEYRLLSYTHDTLREERVNVGVFFYSESARFIEFGIRSDLKSLKHVFWNLEVDNLKSYLLKLRTVVDGFAAQHSSGLPFKQNIEQFLKDLIPGNAGSLEWSRTGSGISNNLEKDFQRILEKFVQSNLSRNEKTGRSDEAVFSTFKTALKKRNNIFDLFKPETINVCGFTQELEYTYQNGVMHCLKPLSFDLGSEKGILNKAIKAKGWYEAISDNNPEKKYKFYYLIGKPKDPDLMKPFDSACKLLLKDEKHTVVLSEERAEDLPYIIENAIHQYTE